MLLLVKVIGIFSTIAVPAGVCGVQVMLTKTQQENHKKAVEKEVQKTQDTLIKAQTNYQKEISRITAEKNALAETKETLTYKPIAIQTKIAELNSAKTKYEEHHKEIQKQITQAIKTHSDAVTQAKTTIEGLWTIEKNRVESISRDLDTKITNVKTANSQLISSIDTTKAEIEKAINAVFYTPAP